MLFGGNFGNLILKSSQLLLFRRSSSGLLFEIIPEERFSSSISVTLSSYSRCVGGSESLQTACCNEDCKVSVRLVEMREDSPNLTTCWVDREVWAPSTVQLNRDEAILLKRGYVDG